MSKSTIATPITVKIDTISLLILIPKNVSTVATSTKKSDDIFPLPNASYSFKESFER